MQQHRIITSSPLGKIGIIVQDKKLTQLTLLDESAVINLPNDALTQHIVAELTHYFENPQHKMDIQIAPKGTIFQQRVWQAMRNIPCGETRTYGELGKQLNTGPRAIGQACRTNPLIIITPCHRIVAASGIGGYSGACNGKWLDVKKWLLTHEKARVFT